VLNKDYPVNRHGLGLSKDLSFCRMNKNLFYNHLIQITSTGISPKTAPPNTDSIIKKLVKVFALAPAPMTIDRNKNNTQRPQSPLRYDVGAPPTNAIK